MNHRVLVPVAVESDVPLSLFATALTGAGLDLRFCADGLTVTRASGQRMPLPKPASRRKKRQRRAS
jgi:hypothetical protein